MMVRERWALFPTGNWHVETKEHVPDLRRFACRQGGRQVVLTHLKPKFLGHWKKESHTEVRHCSERERAHLWRIKLD